MHEVVTLHYGAEISPLGCLYLPDERTAVVADLHIGYEGAAAEDGALFPFRQKSALLRRLGAVLREYRPKRLVINGDFKHAFHRNLRQEWDEVEAVLAYLRKRTEVLLVRGNHDNFLRTILPQSMDLPRHRAVGGTLLMHGDREPESASEVSRTGMLTVIGHEHPSLKLRDELGAFVKVPCFLYDRGARLLVLPALSPLASGADLLAGNFMSPLVGDGRGFEVYGIGGGELLRMGRVRRGRNG